MSEKFCRDCKHLEPAANEEELPMCTAVAPDLVSGEPEFFGGACYSMRRFGARCGPDGALFEPRA